MIGETKHEHQYLLHEVYKDYQNMNGNPGDFEGAQEMAPQLAIERGREVSCMKYGNTEYLRGSHLYYEHTYSSHVEQISMPSFSNHSSLNSKKLQGRCVWKLERKEKSWSRCSC